MKITHQLTNVYTELPFQWEERKKGRYLQKREKEQRTVRRVHFDGTTLILYERFRQTDHSNKRGRIKFGRAVFAGTRPQLYGHVVACTRWYASRRRPRTTDNVERERSTVAVVLHFTDGLH